MDTIRTAVQFFANRYDETFSELDDPERPEDELLLRVKKFWKRIPFILPYLYAVYKDLTDRVDRTLGPNVSFTVLKVQGLLTFGEASETSIGQYEDACRKEPTKSFVDEIHRFAPGLGILSEPRYLAFCLRHAQDLIIADIEECPLLDRDLLSMESSRNRRRRNFYAAHCKPDEVAMDTLRVILGDSGWNKLLDVDEKTIGDWRTQAKKFLPELNLVPGSSSIRADRTIGSTNSSLSSYGSSLPEDSAVTGLGKRKLDDSRSKGPLAPITSASSFSMMFTGVMVEDSPNPSPDEGKGKNRAS